MVGGLNYLFGIPATDLTRVVLIVLITAVATGSVLTGLNVGIKRLSELNAILKDRKLSGFHSSFPAAGGHLRQHLHQGTGLCERLLAERHRRRWRDRGFPGQGLVHG